MNSHSNTEDPDISKLLQCAIESSDPTLLNSFWSLISDRLMAITRRMLRNYPRLQRWEETDDVYQNVVLRLQKSILDVKPESAAGFWGLAITQLRRSLIDLSRHHFCNSAYAANHESHSGAISDKVADPANERNTSGEPLTLEQWTEFHCAVDGLPTEERDAFQLIWYANLNQSVAAATLGISIPTLQRRLYRARLYLHDSLSEKKNGDGKKP